MVRSLIAAALAFALALPATTAPARADAEDVAKVLGGLVLLYGLSRALDNDAPAAPTHSTRNTQGNLHQHRNGAWHRHTGPANHSHARPRPHNHRNTAPAPRSVRLIPSQCFRTFNTPRGQVSGYGARCMQNRVARPGILPPNCIRQVNTNRGLRNLYGPRCLARNGWSERYARR